jgi:hypothetical protein
MPQLDKVTFYYTTFWFICTCSFFYFLLYTIMALPLLNVQNVYLITLLNKLTIINTCGAIIHNNLAVFNNLKQQKFVFNPPKCRAEVPNYNDSIISKYGPSFIGDGFCRRSKCDSPECNGECIFCYYMRECPPPECNYLNCDYPKCGGPPKCPPLDCGYPDCDCAKGLCKYPKPTKTAL